MLFGHLKKEDTSIHVCKKMENLLEKMKKNNWKMLWVIVMLSLVFAVGEYFTEGFQ
jgi:ABC-type nickel/cobalt efflux system permease component RcnA